MSRLRGAGELILYPLQVRVFVRCLLSVILFGYFSFFHAIATFVVKVMGQLAYVKDSHYATALCGVV